MHRRVSSRFTRFAALSLSLLLAATALTVTFDTKPAEAQAQKDIVDTAVAAGQFTTLAKALQAGNLVDTLKGPGPFTVFAPTDAAFAKVPAADLNNTLGNQQLLRSVLTYHVAAGKMTAADLAAKMQVPSVQGGLLNITTQGGPKVNGVNIVQTDIQASNGIIHVIDVVLTPPGAGVMNGMAPAPSASGMPMQQSMPGQLPRAGEADTTALPIGIGLLGLLMVALGGTALFARASSRRA
ncbi:MAG: fasciclin domain-containing protein [Chloroflexota bacterium]